MNSMNIFSLQLFDLKKIILLSLITLMSTHSFCQKDSIFLSAGLKTNSIVNDNDFELSITLDNKSSHSIEIQKTPYFSNFESGFGDIQLDLEKLQANCYERLVVDFDPGGHLYTVNLETLSAQDSKLYKFDLRKIFIMRKGVYRVKAYLFFSRMSKDLKVMSDWVYFEVKTDKYPFSREN